MGGGAFAAEGAAGAKRSLTQAYPPVAQQAQQSDNDGYYRIPDDPNSLTDYTQNSPQYSTEQIAEIAASEAVSAALFDEYGTYIIAALIVIALLLTFKFLPISAISLLITFPITTFSRRDALKKDETLPASVAHLAGVDAPAAHPSEDKLNFAPVARAFAQVLSNKSVEAPLSVALCGSWGSGKSSLMGMTKHELKKRGCPVVWFNAWHHYRENHMLASILTEVRRQVGRTEFLRGAGSFHEYFSAIFFSLPVYLPTFYIRLLWSRLKDSDYWRGFAVIALALLGFVALAIYPELLEMLTRFIPKELLSPGEAPEGGAERFVSSFGSVGGSGVALFALYRTFTKFGISPDKLAKAFNVGLSAEESSDALGYRQKFLRQFGHLANANGGVIVIIIDDLDRCPGDKIGDLLEAMHFLASSGKCHVLSGMDMEWIVSHLALKYERVAKESDKNARALAEEYLEKLFNLAVDVPNFDDTRADALMTGVSVCVENDEEEAPPASAIKNYPLTKTLAAVGVAAIGVLGASLWAYMQRTVETAVVFSGDGAVARIPQVEYDFTGWRIVGSVLIALWVAYIIVRTLKTGVAPDKTKDSDEFVAAVKIWSPYILASHRRTPRAIKRFINRVRFMSALKRGFDDNDKTDEAALVGYAALESFDRANKNNMQDWVDETTIENAVKECFEHTPLKRQKSLQTLKREARGLDAFYADFPVR